MLRRRVIAAFVVVTALIADDLPESVIKLARVKTKVAGWLEHLPNYTCLVTVQRMSQSPRAPAFTPIDKMWYDIAHSNGRELFAWPGSGRFSEHPITTAVTYGVSSDGEFALHAKTVFTGGYATIRFHGREDLNGRESLRWDYVIPLFGSAWTINHAGREAQVSSHGSFWIDAERLDLIRLEVYADGLPADFPDRDASTTVDYGPVRMGARDVLLPQTATLILAEQSGTRNRNVMEFSHCRQYAGESSIRFDTEDAPSTSSVAPESAEAELPSGVPLRLQLSESIDSRTAAIGDPVNAALVTDVIQHGRTLILAGATVRGRIRRIERQAGPAVPSVVEIEFIEMEFSGKRARFFGELKRLEGSVNGLRTISSPAIPGAARLSFEGSSFHLSRGTIMLWTTEGLKRLERSGPSVGQQPVRFRY